MTEVSKIEFHNAINDCRKQLNFVLDIYREMVGAFERGDWKSHGPALAISNAEKAQVFTPLELTRVKENWQLAIEEAQGLSKGGDFGEVQKKLETKIFDMPFNCALASVDKLRLR